MAISTAASQQADSTEGRELPNIIQGGMGAAVSSWRLASQVAKAGQLGVVSGIGLDMVLARRLQDGDKHGHMRRALAAFPVPAVADEVLELGGPVARGFGSLRVDVAIGDTAWRTSIFPSDSAGTYVLPIKKAVRSAQGLQTGDTVRVRLTLVDA